MTRWTRWLGFAGCLIESSGEPYLLDEKSKKTPQENIPACIPRGEGNGFVIVQRQQTAPRRIIRGCPGSSGAQRRQRTGHQPERRAEEHAPRGTRRPPRACVLPAE